MIADPLVLSAQQKALYVVLCGHTRPHQGRMTCWPTQETLGAMLGVTPRTIHTWIERLKAIGAIDAVEYREGGHRRLRITVHQTPPDDYEGPISYGSRDGWYARRKRNEHIQSDQAPTGNSLPVAGGSTGNQLPVATGNQLPVKNTNTRTPDKELRTKPFWSKSAISTDASPPLFDSPDEPAPPDPRKDADREFGEFWQKYPRKVARGTACKAWKVARKKTSFEAIMAGLDAYVNYFPRKTADSSMTAHPSTWLNGERWNDDLTDNRPTTPTRNYQGPYRETEKAWSW